VNEVGLYVMSVAAELMDLHPSTLRLWERRGLVAPSRTAGGTRLYSDADLHRMRRVADLTRSGVNLEGIRRILILEDELAAIRVPSPRTEPAPPPRPM